MSRSSGLAGRAFSPMAMIIVALVGIVSLAGLGVLSAYAPELQKGDDGGAHALSNSSVGFGGLAKLLPLTGAPVTLSRGRLGDTAADSLVILTPPVGVNPDQVGDLEAGEPRRSPRRRPDRPSAHASVNPAGGPALIILPKWSAMPDKDRRGWVTTTGLHYEGAVLRVLPEQFGKGAKLARRTGSATVSLRRPNGAPVGTAVKIDQLQTLSGPGWIPVVTDASGGMVVGMKEGTWTYVLADPDFLNTQGLKTLAGARTSIAVLDLLRARGAPVILDLTLHGFQRTRNVLRLLLEPPLLGLTLLLAAVALLAGLQAAVRFGPAHEVGRKLALGKQALADNTAGLVRLARREHSMAAPYASLVKSAVVRSIGAPRTLSEPDLAAFLDRVGANAGATLRYSALAERASAARTPNDLMQIARDLNRWKQEMTRGRQ